ncbi:MAG: long-chain fatty acid--CoA ligase, partial [Planctomycetota bacterium]|nr:long-chain fatty acid--CoA ligase [Planctomycetota bacterium]
LVNPEAVERVLVSQPGVEDAVCRAEPHPLLGLVPVAEVVMQPQATFDGAALREGCRSRIESHALPRRIVEAEPWSLAESGKRRRPAGPAG